MFTLLRNHLYSLNRNGVFTLLRNHLYSLNRNGVFSLTRNIHLRTKTGVHLDFKLRNHSLKILEVYNQKSMNSYLFPLLLMEDMTTKQIKYRSHKLLGQINPALKEMMEVLKISKHITFYTARHTFATFLKFENTPIDAISEMLGHTDIRTTQAYLNKLPNKKLDKIIDDVFENSKYF
ncbi:tyrosine-type recombinase/integrase [Flavobacterium sp. RSP49]|uniref:tyrosine-type recombinase/integrase n=1 Tax=Flavobacterium sp. RSP49 TaxID=2497487 RepID=UPI002936D565|nr:tyrosine-type recombinase/integrase [Flavobacterium sp. RSP49]